MDKDFTGFIAHYSSKESVQERNFFFDDILDRIVATNWIHVDKNRIIILELWWRGELKHRITKCPGITEWLFYHTGTQDSKGLRIISRTIGILVKDDQYTATVDEETGLVDVKCSKKPAPIIY